jgi:hypothetical protein
MGISMGFSQLTMYIIFAMMFYFGGLVMEADFQHGTKPEDIFIALFAMMFGAQQAGTASAMGPDMAKANEAALKIFKIIERESLIDAVDMDEDLERPAPTSS